MRTKVSYFESVRINGKTLSAGFTGFLNKFSHKFFSFLCMVALSFLACQGQCYSADQFEKIQPAGTASASDIDALILVNNEALDRMLYTYQEGAAIQYSSAAQFTVSIGALAMANSGGSIVKMRRNTAATTVTFANIDTGAEASSTTYFAYGVADTDATTFTIEISTSSTAPSGATYYARLGSFYNDASGNISNISNDNDLYKEIGAWAEFTGSGSVSVSDSYNVSSISYVSTGVYTVTIDTDFPNANYSTVCGPGLGGDCYVDPATKTVGAFTIYNEDQNSGGAKNGPMMAFIASGDRN